MLTSMLSRMITGIVIGGAIGWLVAGPTAGLIGILLGTVVAFLIPFVRSAARKPRAGAVVHHEQHHIRCYPRGLEADCEFLKDDRGRWLDVEHCSLMPHGGAPTCEKRCLVLMNDVA